jgi:hypothetical protein
VAHHLVNVFQLRIVAGNSLLARDFRRQGVGEVQVKKVYKHENRLAVVGGIIIILFALAAIFAIAMFILKLFNRVSLGWWYVGVPAVIAAICMIGFAVTMVRGVGR